MIMSIRLHSSSSSSRQRPFFFPFFQPTACRLAAVAIAPVADRYAYVYDVYIHTHAYISHLHYTCPLYATHNYNNIHNIYKYTHNTPSLYHRSEL